MMKYDCAVCGKNVQRYRRGKRDVGKYCSAVCSGFGRRKPLDFKKIIERLESGIYLRDVAKEWNIDRCLLRIRLKEFGYTVKRLGVRGEKNVKWKGGKVGYGAFHERVVVRRGEPRKCVMCEKEDQSRYEWANVTGYYPDVSDYIRLCTSCHKIFDLKRPVLKGDQTVVSKKVLHAYEEAIENFRKLYVSKEALDTRRIPLIAVEEIRKQRDTILQDLNKKLNEITL